MPVLPLDSSLLSTLESSNTAELLKLNERLAEAEKQRVRVRSAMRSRPERII